MAWSLLTVNAMLRRVLRQTEVDGENDLAAAIVVFEALVDSSYTTVSAGAGQVISTSANGKTVTISVSAGLSSQDILECADAAISVLTAGGTQLSDRSFARF